MRAFVLCLLALPFSGLTQDSLRAPAPHAYPPFNLRIAPLSLINPVRQVLFFQADFPMSQRWVFDMGLGFIYNAGELANNKGEKYHGVKVQPMAKYYYRKATRRGGRPTFGMGLKFTHMANDRFVSVLRQGGQYQEFMLHRRTRTTAGIIFQFAIIDYIGKKKRWLVEPFFGLGPRFIRIREADLPPDAQLLRETGIFSFERDAGTHYEPDFQMGLNVGYVLSKGSNMSHPEF